MHASRVPERLRLAALITLLAFFSSACSLLGAAPTPVRPSRRPSAVVQYGNPSPAPASDAPTSPPAATPRGEHAEVIDAFLANFALRNPPFHVDSDIHASGSGGAEPINIRLRINGDTVGQDFDGEVSVPGKGSVRVRFVDGVGYARLPGTDWVVEDDFEQTQPLNPFGLLKPEDLEYVGQVQRGRRSLHKLRTSEWIGGDLRSVGLVDLELLSTVFDIYVGNKGLPVEAVLDFSISGRVSGRQATFEYHVVYRFSNIGDLVSIEAPV